MSRYTTELRWVIEQTLDDLNLEHSETNWPHVFHVLGLDDYPLFDESYRTELNTKIIRHYYTREIGAETVGRFRLFVRDAMWRIMPYYNQLYQSELEAKKIEPLGDRKMGFTEHAWGNATNEGTTNAQNVFQDTPQSEMIPAQIKAMQYATNVSLDEGSSTGSGTYDNMVERKEEGYTRPQTELLKLYRETFLNIDRDIIEDAELASCFMTVW